MYPQICLILLATCTPAGDEGPTLMPALRPVAASEPQPIAVEEPPILLMPRKLDDPPKSAPALTKPVPQSTQPVPQPTQPAPKAVAADALKEGAAKLQAERQALQNEMRQGNDDTANAPKKYSDEAIKKRLRLAELLTQAGKVRRERPTPATPPPSSAVVEKTPAVSPSTPHASPHGTGSIAAPEKTAVPNEHAKVTPPDQGSKGSDHNRSAGANSGSDNGNEVFSGYSLADKPVEPLALAQALFRTGDYEGSLAVYLGLLQKEPIEQEKVTLQYMIACCYRKLGKYDQAYTYYLEVVNSKRDEVLAECAIWQLDAMKWRKDLESRLAQVKQRRQALEIKP
jgi:tetratricopeptide (TPR) repeat protein